MKYKSGQMARAPITDLKDLINARLLLWNFLLKYKGLILLIQLMPHIIIWKQVKIG